MNFSLKSDHVMIFLLLVFLAVIIVSVYHQHRLMNSSFNLFDLLMVNGKLSHGHVFSTGGWLLHTWTVAFWTLQGTVKSEDFLVYSGIWITPYFDALVQRWGVVRRAE